MIKINDVDIHCRDYGNGFPIILIHGLSDSSYFWDPLINRLSGHYRTVVPDLRGHGVSSKTNRISMELFTHDVEKLMEELDIEETIIIGFSLGASISLNFTLEHPKKVKSLVLLSSYCYNGPELVERFQNLQEITRDKGVGGFFDEMIKLVYPKKYIFDEEILAESKEIALDMNTKESLIHSLEVCKNFNVGDRINEIKIPTLIFCGNEDILIDPKNSEELNMGIKNSKLIKLDKVGHNLLLPASTDEIVRDILRFLGEI